MHFLDGEELPKNCSKCVRRTQSELHTLPSISDDVICIWISMKMLLLLAFRTFVCAASWTARPLFRIMEHCSRISVHTTHQTPYKYGRTVPGPAQVTVLHIRGYCACPDFSRLRQTTGRKSYLVFSGMWFFLALYSCKPHSQCVVCAALATCHLVLYHGSKAVPSVVE